MPRKKNPAAATATTTTKATQPGATTPTSGPATVHPHAALFTERELTRLGTLADEIKSLRERAAALLARADTNAGLILVLAVNDGRECSPDLAAEVLRDIDAVTDAGSPVEPSFGFKVRAHAAKCRAKFKLAAAQQEFEALRDLAGATTLADRLAGASNAGQSPVEAMGTALGLNDSTNNGGGSSGGPVAGPGTINAPAADDCPDA